MPQVRTRTKGKRKLGKRDSAGIREPLSREILQRVGEALLQRRNELGLSQSQVASAIGYKASTVWNYEAGLQDPWLKMPTLKWLAYLRVLKITEDELAQMIGFEDSSIFYGKQPKDKAGPAISLKKLQDVDREGNPSGYIVLGLPELEPYRESDLFVYRTTTGMRIVMKKVKKPKSELVPGELVLIDEGDGQFAAYRYNGWENTRPSRMMFSRAGETFSFDPDSVLAKGVLTIGKPELRL